MKAFLEVSLSLAQMLNKNYHIAIAASHVGKRKLVLGKVSREVKLGYIRPITMMSATTWRAAPVERNFEIQLSNKPDKLCT